MQPLLIEVPYSHLFPGLWLPTRSGGYETQKDTDVILIFADDSSTTAILRYDEESGGVLSVAAYRTRRGTSIDERVWELQDVIEEDGELRIRLGRSVR